MASSSLLVVLPPRWLTLRSCQYLPQGNLDDRFARRGENGHHCLRDGDTHRLHGGPIVDQTPGEAQCVRLEQPVASFAGALFRSSHYLRIVYRCFELIPRGIELAIELHVDGDDELLCARAFRLP